MPRYCEEYRDPVKPVVMPKSLRNLRNSKCDSMNREEFSEYCATLIERVQVTEEAASKIERETKEQAQISIVICL